MRIGKYIKGFTLIEIMVVISIIAFLSSVVFANLAIAKIKAQDSARTQTARQVDLAIKSYILDKKVAPQNYTSNGEFAFSDAAPDGTNMNAFQKSMKLLVDAGYLSKIPEQIGGVPFFYYNSGAQYGAIFGTSLVASTASSVGVSNSCRPYSSPDTNSCSTLMGYVASNNYPNCTLQGSLWTCDPTSPITSLPYCQSFIDSINVSDIAAVWSSFEMDIYPERYLTNFQTKKYYYTYGISYADMQYLISQTGLPQQTMQPKHCSTAVSTDVCYCSPI